MSKLYFRKSIRRGCVFLLSGSLLLFALVLYTNLFVYKRSKGHIYSYPEFATLFSQEEFLSGHSSFDCILILGASVQENRTPSMMLRDRLNTGIWLYQNHVSSKLLMSGDYRHPSYNEVGVMKEYASSQGVPEENIWTDPAGLSTYESIYRAKYIFGGRKILIVSQSYHLYRAVYLADCFDLEVTGVICDTGKYQGQTLRNLREILARTKDCFLGLLQPVPD